MHSPDQDESDIIIRTGVRAGDLGYIVSMHGIVYAGERGFDATFEAYVAGPLAEFVGANNPRERIWLAERKGRIIGCVAIVAVSTETAQLRWFLVDPSARGKGLGRRLLQHAIAFSRECGYAEVILWTESALTAAAHLYQSAGFRLTTTKPGRMWGVELIEEKYEMRLH
jgi:GNAT superfamily N-acetyltransferase